MHLKASFLTMGRKTHWLVLSLAVCLLIVALFMAINQRAGAQGSPFHPPFALLDTEGVNVLESGNPISTMQTCGTCHDVDFIEQHSFHTDLGLSTLTVPGEAASGLAWDMSDGLFGEWNPIMYRYLSPATDERVDLTTAEWLQIYGLRHAGGGPAIYARDGELTLLDLDTDANPVETQIIDPETGELTAWDWQESGVVEMNCFLCHLDNSNDPARIEALESGAFQWANTATLVGTGVVEQVNNEWQWNPDAFAENGELIDGQLAIQDPSNENCGQCHGLVHVDPETPLVLDDCEPTQWSTITTGQIFSPQRLSDTGLNFEDKDNLTRSWDIHAERVVACTDCHYSLNNPVYYQEGDETRPDHLEFDPRRIDLGEYLYRPLHQFAKGESSQGDLAAEFDNTIRRCETCHATEKVHDWLPYQERHMSAVSCETCHVPKLYAPAREYNDWTVLTANGAPQTACRGIDSAGSTGETFGASLLEGYEPVLLPRQNKDGSTSLAPYNLVTSWYWVYDDPARPVPYRDLQAAWFDGDKYQADVLTSFDNNGDGQLNDTELVIDTDAKAILIADRLKALGLENPRIMSDLRPYSISHGVTHGEWATKDCQVCHSDDSRINQPLTLADRVPNGILPVLVSNDSTILNGEVTQTDDGSLIYQPLSDSEPLELYVFGHDSISWIDWLGVLMFLGVMGGVSMHSTLRYVSARRRAPHDAKLRREYMYSVYERQWHWLQTIVIMGLLFTGLIIHKPDTFGAFSFKFVVEVHNILAAILVINAFLAMFYHLASGEIRQYMPEPRGFFSQAIEQTMYYARGIFKGEPHPVEKTRNRKMNPLQQVTYLAILNVLLPLQVITGALMWGAQTWPDVADALGGLQVLSPLHTLVAWSFAAFIVAHVYLTTTAGHTPAAGIKSMITGWDDLEVHGNGENDHSESHRETHNESPDDSSNQGSAQNLEEDEA